MVLDVLDRLARARNGCVLHVEDPVEIHQDGPTSSDISFDLELVATLTGTNTGPWAGAAATGLPVALQVIILFPWDPATERFSGERIWFDRGA